MEVYLALQKLERLRKRAPRRIQILRDGDIGIEGWPEDMRLTPAVAANIIEQFEHMGNKLPLDYEHSSKTVEQGTVDKAPAAGWIADLEYVPGDGLYAYVDWTDEGRQDVENGAYKYTSPVICRNDTGSKKTRDQWKLHSVALTNRPATREQRELLAASLRAEETELDDMPKTKRATPKKRTIHKANDPVLEELAADPEITPEAADKVGDVNESLEALAEALRQAGHDVPDEYAAEDIHVLAIQAIAGAEESEEEAPEEMPEAASIATSGSTLAAQVKAMSASLRSVTAELAGIKTERQDKAVETMIAEQIAANKINPNDESQMHAARLLAEDNPDIFKATYGSLPAYVEPGEMTTHSGSAPTGGRAKVITEAIREWNGNTFNQGAPIDGYVNVALDEFQMANLSKAESEKLRS